MVLLKKKIVWLLQKEKLWRNFAGIFSVWDHLFGTYCKDPAAGQQGKGLGLRLVDRGVAELGRRVAEHRRDGIAKRHVRDGPR